MHRNAHRQLATVAGLTWLAILLAVGPAALAGPDLDLGDSLPPISLPRADGAAGTIDLATLAGRPSVILFWRPQQRLSLEALRDLRSLRETLGAERIGIVAVDSGRSTDQEVRAALAGEDAPFPVVLDPQRALYGQLGVIVSPTTYLADDEGRLRFKVASHPREYVQIVTARLRFLLGEIDETQMDREIEPTALKIDENLAAAWRMYNLGRKLQREGKPDEAMTVFEQAISQYPSLAEARCTLGFMKLASGELDVAAQHFRTALTYQPDAPVGLLGQAAVLARTGHPAEAEQILLGLLGHKSIAARVRYELGRLYRLRGEDGRALAFYDAALSTIFPEPGPAATESIEPPAVGTVPPPAGAAAAPSSPAVDPIAVAVDRPQVAVEPVQPPADAAYLGVKGCKKCHFQQWKSWKDTKMARSLELLEPGIRGEAKTLRGLEPQRDYTAEPACLRCHTTGYGHPGGYPTTPPGDPAGVRLAGELAGVGCESCHGPGSRFVDVHKDIQDNKRQYGQSELYAAGQYQIDIRVCVGCHLQDAPCIGPEISFDFETRKDEGTHTHYDLKFRTDAQP
jgi:tetratricopeptide (TPR) repeat protein